jgi:TPR repeat protein
LLLSDLYAKGDGVPKSCDQARLLLTVAARKGQAEAASRLQSLNAGGCQ